NDTYELEKDVVVVTSRDVEPAEQAKKATELLDAVQSESFADNLADHTAIWEKRWEQSDIVIAGDEAAQQGIRFNILQLFM
ncbi:MAG: glycoside hydrolase family 65 protein, partial [Lactobacillus iners]|nr:glycoside hydrolase family 65 protein [Lactobacillus iners]